MLKRLYIDNYKACSNLEIKFESINLMMGDNGTGKSTILEVLRNLQLLLVERVEDMNYSLHTLFPPSTVTRWDQRDIQRIELDIQSKKYGLFRYELEIDFDDSRQASESSQPKRRIKLERLYCEGVLLVDIDVWQAKLYKDSGEFNTYAVFDWGASAISIIRGDHNNHKLQWFRERMRRIVVVQITPALMSNTAHDKNVLLDIYGENFLTWYRLHSRDTELLLDFALELRNIWHDFKGFNSEKIGRDIHNVTAKFIDAEFSFDELSQGQKSLVALYFLYFYAKQNGDFTLCIDEPSNFIALAEIQPWLDRIIEATAENHVQALLISHNSELLNYLAPSYGILFKRGSNSASIQAQSFEFDPEETLPVAELMARRWLDA